MKQEQKRRTHGVRLYRSYRTGELPDIQIPHKGVITPLAALAQLDSSFTRILTSEIVNAIIRVKKDLDDNEEVGGGKIIRDDYENLKGF